jgi:hypothetical protein
VGASPFVSGVLIASKVERIEPDYPKAVVLPDPIDSDGVFQPKGKERVRMDFERFEPFPRPLAEFVSR